ncbi:hypothetical protein BDY19DRAFT_914852 [Irpex rosettiformis]|uniref:Uncharacterized protein n=1 Tax=Irpex rosettiformis TaxID=378272 RepID=A0ACB8UM33_9APHY|nr:hypothetical protein BDY19DRAFT_914852 [Irpex rosettiformis]
MPEAESDVCRTLPQEVIDMIIDFLHDDRRTLKSCAEVAKSWVRVSYYHLFRKFRIEATPSFKAGYSAQLQAILRSSFYPYIHELTAVPIPTRSSLYPELTEEDVVAFFTSLPRLRSLRLDQTGFTRHLSRPQPARRFSADRLSINWMYPSIPGSSSSTSDLLLLFYEIRELDLKVIHRKHLSDAISFEGREPPPPIMVDTLTLSDVSGPLLRLLRRLISGDRLHTMRVSIAATADVVELGELLSTVGSNIYEFQLAIWNFWSNDFADWDVLGLTNCPNLQSVVILYANSGPFYSWETVYGLLAAVPARVRQVTIVVRDEYCLNSANWARLRQTLEHLTNLQRIQFRLCRGGDLFKSREVPQKVLEGLCRALPSFKTRGLLC